VVLHLFIALIVALFTSETQIKILLFVVLNKPNLRDVFWLLRSFPKLICISVVIIDLILVTNVIIILNVVSFHHIIPDLSSDYRDLEDGFFAKVNHLNKCSLELQVICVKL
jgi:hypothetical protein